MTEHLHSQISKLVSEIRQDSLDIKCTTETLRYLRNLCATDKLSQIKVGEDKDCVDLMCVLFDKILERPASDENIICLRVGCQFIGNLIVDNRINQLQVHNKCFDHIRKLMLFGDEKLSHFCAMILYNIILSHPDACQDILKEDDLLKAILCQDSEFATFLIEKLLLQNGEIERLYTNCDGLDGQVMLLAMLREQTAAGNTSVPEKCIRFIADTFKRQSDRILKIVSTYVESLDPKEICLLLETLASLSGDSPYLEMLQADHSLFINCAFLLRSIHEAGKTGNNYFTIVKKLPEENSKSRENPVYGFKADLIRLLGNLCYRHDTNKNQIRELECIPILLDCCNIDDSNPFILQWSILALKNISEKNHENQAIIAGLARKDVAHSPILEELGYTMHSEDGKGIRIAPLKRP